MRSINQTTAKILYTLLFLVVLPLILWLWSVFLDRIIALPVIKSIQTGNILMLTGLLLMLWAMYSLKKYGKGLPMNPFPPKHFVTRGPYKIFSHPIYIGFIILVTGFFIRIGTPSGLWIITPLCILGITALLMGYENLDLKKRFPDKKSIALLGLPKKNIKNSKIINRFRALFLVVGLLLLSNFIIRNLISTEQVVYASGLNLDSLDKSVIDIPGLGIAFICLVIILLKGSENLRAWALYSAISLGIHSFLLIFFPGIIKYYLIDTTPQIFTVPVIIFLLSAIILSRRSILLGLFSLLVGVGIILLKHEHYPINLTGILISIIIVLLAVSSFQIWKVAKHISEKIANSWKEWTIGNIRVINHGFYVGLGSFLGILLAGILVGDQFTWAILIFSIIVIIFSALWAQIIEGSEKLKRPYGYYGALVGIIFASIAVSILDFNVWIIIGVISVCMPWIQAVGRLRCLINGCCHGSKTSNSFIGIRYFHPRSRVCNISKMKGELLHPTPLYSISWLFIVGLILLSLWIHRFPMSLIFGIYLILTSIGRFVEEAYRGEVQTPIIMGLRLYQWTAILFLFIGIIFTCIPSEVFHEKGSFGWQSLLSALIGGLFTTFAMGVDFPNSNARFSRLV